MTSAPDDNDGLHESGGGMRRERRIPFLLFVVCLVAAMPVSWGAGDHKDLDGAERLNAAVSPPRRVPPRQVVELETVPSPVPKTGQTTCWDENGTPIDCAGTGQDGELQKGVLAGPRFSDNADGTVKDNLTGLIWLKDANCFGNKVWNDALTVSKTLASGACGLSDGSVAGAWRLPNVKEFESLFDLGHLYPALPVGHPFSGVTSFYYWSSTSYAHFPFFAWAVLLGEGEATGWQKSDEFYVWPVRGGQ